jgi:hypothetical protein
MAVSEVRGNPEIGWRLRQALFGIGVAAALVGTTAANNAPSTGSLHYSGTVSIDQSRQWFMTSAAGRGGVLHFGRRTYRFAITGLTAGRSGVTPLRAKGAVYNLASFDRFPGRYTALSGESSTAGKLWLRNGQGVVLAFENIDQGTRLSMGADAVSISYH